MRKKQKMMLQIQEIKTGDIGICRGKRFLSRAIMFATGSKWSHACLFYWQNGTLMVADSQKDGFNGKTFDNWVKDFDYEFKVLRSNKRSTDIEDKIKSILGTTPYDFESLFFRQPRKIIVMTLNRFRANDKQPWKDRGTGEDDRMYCSESCAFCLGIKSAERMSPEDLNNYAELNNFLEIGRNF